VQILGTCFISDRENVGWKNVQHSFGFASFHPSSSSPFHIHPVLFILCSPSWRVI